MRSIVVSSFDDYRSLLEALFQFEQAASKGVLTKKIFAKKIGLSDSNLRMICSHKRSLTLENALTICKKMRFNTEDVEHFLNLVYQESLKSAQTKRVFQAHLDQVKINRQRQLTKLSSEDELLDSTLQAILIYIKDRGLNLEDANPKMVSAIAQKFGLSSKEIENILEKILKLDVHLGDPNGVHIVFSKLTNNFRRDDFLKKEFQTAAQNVKNVKNPDYYYSAKIFSIPRDEMSKFAQEYKLLAEKYIALPKPDEETEQLSIVRVLFHMSPFGD
jgi:plasmid maintenance system antidote protein VapI